MTEEADQAKAFVIDRDLCAGHGRCYTVAPDSFSYDETGYGIASGRPEVDRTADQIEDVVTACPEEAISTGFVTTGPQSQGVA